ncbi:hypothetical protein EDB89DRAFT_2244400 [Lactarius sanguifluus]|nr:hypothetical protein EDB89DRAFT_2244400 [Lactarius sanguifluus]
MGEDGVQRVGPESGGWDGGWSREGECAGKVEVEMDGGSSACATSTTMMPATSNGFHYDSAMMMSHVSALRDPDPNKPDVATCEPNPDPDYHHAATGAFRRRKMGCTVRLNHDEDVGDEDGQSWLQQGHEDGNNHHYHDRNQVVMTTTSTLKRYDIVITSYEVVSNEVTTLEEFNLHY